MRKRSELVKLDLTMLLKKRDEQSVAECKIQYAIFSTETFGRV
jgi:hypothetical protein